jgi:hypothetical protein
MVQSIALTALALLAASPAYAYLDPGTGSMLVQGLVAAIAVASGAIVAFWTRLKQMASRRRASPPAPRDDARP